VFDGSLWVQRTWKELKVGDLVRLVSNCFLINEEEEKKKKKKKKKKH
jgi:hypothetical protein